MSEFYNGRHIAKTRKDHGCYDCGKTIPAGSEAHKSCTVWDGEFLHGYFCYDCLPGKYPKILSTEGAKP